MPPYKKVKSLVDICVRCVNNIFLNDFKETKKSSKEMYYSGRYYLSKKINVIKRYYLGNVSPLICEMLLHYLSDDLFLCDYYKAMFLQLYRHKYMTVFNPSFKLPRIKGFFESYFVGLNNLVVLNLEGICTDELLEVVGNNCPLLEKIHIDSKAERISLFAFRYHVSDIGLSYLHKCKNLKEIFMDNPTSSYCTEGRKFTNEGVRSLLYSLPNITYLSYDDMGAVLEGWNHSKKLRLVHINNERVIPEHIDLIEEICPSIKILNIRPAESDATSVSNNCLERLKHCNVDLRSLGLMCFTYGLPLLGVLESKGANLTNLFLNCSLITAENIMTIGVFCRKLEQLGISYIRPSESDYKISHSQQSSKCFVSLKTLRLFGERWNPEVIFPLVLYNAKHLEYLLLSNDHYQDNLDSFFKMLLKRNELYFLSKLMLLNGFNLSHAFAVDFILGLKNLKEFVSQSKCKMKNIIEECNLDLVIKTEEEEYF